MNRINLYKEFFIEKERTVFSGDSLKATLFKYSTGIEAVKLSNDKGYGGKRKFSKRANHKSDFIQL